MFSHASTECTTLVIRWLWSIQCVLVQLFLPQRRRCEANPQWAFLSASSLASVSLSLHFAEGSKIVFCCFTGLLHLITFLLCSIKWCRCVIVNFSASKLACIMTPHYNNYNPPNYFVSLEPSVCQDLACSPSVLAWVFTNTLLACCVWWWEVFDLFCG